MRSYIKHVVAVVWRLAIFLPLTAYAFSEFVLAGKYYGYSGPLHELIYATDELGYGILIKGMLLGIIASFSMIVVRNSRRLTYVFLIAYISLTAYSTVWYIIPAKLMGDFQQAAKSGEVRVIRSYFRFPRNQVFRHRKSARVTPLIWLIQNQRTSLANEYIELGNPVDKEYQYASAHDPLSALASHLPPSGERRKLYDSLISLGAKANNYACNRKGRICLSAIQIAVKNNDLELVKWLVRDGASIDDSRYINTGYFSIEDLDVAPTLLKNAIGSGSSDVASFLLEQHKLNFSHTEIEKLEALITVGGGLRAGDSRTLKSMALEYRDRFAPHFLGFLYKYAGPGTKNWELFDWLIDNGIAYSPNPSFIDKTKECHYSYKNGRRLDYTSPYARTLQTLFTLSFPRYNPKGQCRRVLRFMQMEQCRTTNVLALSKWTPLAAKAGCTDVVEYFLESLESPFDAYQLTGTQRPAIYLAVASGNADILKLFIDRYISLEDLQQPFKKERGVFQAALKFRQPSTIEYLLNEGLYKPDCSDFAALVTALFPYVDRSKFNTENYLIPENLNDVLQKITGNLVEQGFVTRCSFDPAPFLNGKKGEEYKQVFQRIGIN